MNFPIESVILHECVGDAREGVGVTVLVTLYNYGRYIEETLATVIAQTYRNIELIVVDDASKDDSRERVCSWMEQHGGRFARTALVTHAQNYGVHQARNTGYTLASNEYFFVLDADNQIYPTAVERLLAACLQSGADAAYSQIEWFGERTGLGYAAPWRPARLADGNYVDAMALIRKSAWQAVGGYDLFEPRGLEDYDFWCKFVERNLSAIFVPQILCRYRVHRRSLSATQALPKDIQGKLEMLLRHPWLALRVDQIEAHNSDCGNTAQTTTILDLNVN